MAHVIRQLQRIAFAAIVFLLTSNLQHNRCAAARPSGPQPAFTANASAGNKNDIATPSIERYTTPKAAIRSNRKNSFTIRLKNGMSVSKFLNADNEAIISVEDSSGKQLLTLPAKSILGDTDDFCVVQGPFTSNADVWVLIANRASESNGMAVSDWHITILRELIRNGTVSAFSERVDFSVQDFSVHENILLANGSVFFIATEWQNGEVLGLSPANSLYLVGRPYRLKKGQLIPATERPIVARRYTYNFEKSRIGTRQKSFDATSSRGSSPCLLLDKYTRKLGFDRQMDDRSAQVLAAGVVSSVSLEKVSHQTEPRLNLVLVGDEGRRTTNWCYLRGGDFNDSIESDRHDGCINYLGINKSHRFLPRYYDSKRIETWLKGKPVRMIRYANGPTVCWVL